MRRRFRDIALTLEKVYSSREAEQLAKMMICHVCDLTTTDLLIKTDFEPSPDQTLLLQNYLRRMLLGEPIQYIMGEEEFFGLIFNVSPDVLIPRPETAELVALILQELPQGGGRFLDIGTGSGCIAISLFSSGSWNEAEGWDISPEALSIARLNNSRHNTSVQFVQQDILMTEPADFESKYDLIVSNPPYITLSEQTVMHRNVLDYEPHKALFVPDADPLLFYKAIGRFASSALKPGGLLCLEINASQGEATRQRVASYGFDNVQLMKDADGRDRFIKAQKR